MKYFLILPFLIILFSCTQNEENQTQEEKKEVNIYSHRHYEVDKQLYEEFTKETGIEVNVVKSGADELMERLKSEGENSEADLLITVDAGRLYRAQEMGLLQSIDNESIKSIVPKNLQAPDGSWFALTKRARVIVYNPEKVNQDELSTYEDLANEKWKGRILSRSSSNIYNQSLMAAVVAHYPDSEIPAQWVDGVYSNLAKKPKGNDRDQIKAVVAGVGDLAIVNTYYMGLMLNSEDEAEREVAQKVKVFYPIFENGGTHINISGVGVTKYAPNKENAIKLIEFLLTKESQKLYSEANYEFPVVADVQESELLESWGSLVEDEIDVYLLGKYNAEAVKLYDQAGWE